MRREGSIAGVLGAALGSKCHYLLPLVHTSQDIKVVINTASSEILKTWIFFVIEMSLCT